MQAPDADGKYTRGGGQGQAALRVCQGPGHLKARCAQVRSRAATHLKALALYHHPGLYRFVAVPNSGSQGRQLVRPHLHRVHVVNVLLVCQTLKHKKRRTR